MISKGASGDLSLESIAAKLTYFELQTHLLHWQTFGGFEHAALGDMYELIFSIKDEIVEKIMGYQNKRVKSHGIKGQKPSKKTILAIIESNKKRIGSLNPGSRKIINTVTGEIFNSGKEASDKLRIPISTLRAKLIGTRTNDTSLIYLL
jgi:DNA-binding ferritin-like protein